MKSLGPFHLLLILALAELAIYRLLVPALQPVIPAGQPVPETPIWRTAIDYLGLFLHYFTGTLAIGILVMRAIKIRNPQGTRWRELLIGATAGGAALACAAGLVIGLDPPIGFLLEAGLLISLVGGLVASIRRGTDWGATIGLVFLLVPFATRFVGVFGAQFLWDEDSDHAAIAAQITAFGVSMVTTAAIASPYCFGPRPFARAVTRFVPVIVAMLVAGACATIARRYYLDAADVAQRGLGIALDRDRVDRQLALYILAFATLAWTLTSCAIADTEPRRRVGLGLALIVIGGYTSVIWAAYYAVIAVGFLVIVDAIPQLRRAEQTEPITIATPPIEDRIWQEFVTALVAGLRRAGHRVHALTTRGEDDTVSTIVSGDVASRPFRMRIERIAGCVVVIDARFGRDLLAQPATFTVHARPESLRDPHPEPPPANGAIKLGDVAFETRFRARGDRDELLAALDDGVRARLTALMDGWLALWKGESVRHRIYPGRGAPIDHPIPLSDLAIRRAGPDTADRMIRTVELLADIARRTLPEALPEPERTDDELPFSSGEGG